MATSAGEDFTVRTAPYRRELLAHCYRMLGSVQDAEDLLQETLLRAWRAFDRYDPRRATLRTWLHRIATNACLTALEQRSRRPLPSGLGAPGGDPGNRPTARGDEVPWLQPIPDAMLGDPAGSVLARGSLRLAFVAAMQLLPARQRAVLILREVLGWPAAEVAEALDMTTAAVNSALQRARARLGEAGLSEEEIHEPGPGHRAQVERYVAAFESADMAALEKLLAEDVVLEMPPFLAWYAGREAYLRFMDSALARRGTYWRALVTGANGQPALAGYAPAGDGGYALHSLQVLTLTAAGLVARNTVFPGEEVGARFALPDRIGAART